MLLPQTAQFSFLRRMCVAAAESRCHLMPTQPGSTQEEEEEEMQKPFTSKDKSDFRSVPFLLFCFFSLPPSLLASLQKSSPSALSPWIELSYKSYRIVPFWPFAIENTMHQSFKKTNKKTTSQKTNTLQVWQREVDLIAIRLMMKHTLDVFWRLKTLQFASLFWGGGRCEASGAVRTTVATYHCSALTW